LTSSHCSHVRVASDSFLGSNFFLKRLFSDFEPSNFARGKVPFFPTKFRSNSPKMLR
jgi:hypothetical protein